MILDAVYLLQCIAWPAALAFCVWRAAKTIDAHLANVARELNDPVVHAAKAKADDAWRKANQLSESLEQRSASYTAEINEIKSALIDR